MVMVMTIVLLIVVVRKSLVPVTLKNLHPLMVDVVEVRKDVLLDNVVVNMVGVELLNPIVLFLLVVNPNLENVFKATIKKVNTLNKKSIFTKKYNIKISKLTKKKKRKKKKFNI